METYTSGEEPRVGDVVEPASEQDRRYIQNAFLGHKAHWDGQSLLVVVHARTGVTVRPEGSDGKGVGFFRDRFKLVARAGEAKAKEEKKMRPYKSGEEPRVGDRVEPADPGEYEDIRAVLGVRWDGIASLVVDHVLASGCVALKLDAPSTLGLYPDRFKLVARAKEEKKMPTYKSGEEPLVGDLVAPADPREAEEIRRSFPEYDPSEPLHVTYVKDWTDLSRTVGVGQSRGIEHGYVVSRFKLVVRAKEEKKMEEAKPGMFQVGDTVRVKDQETLDKLNHSPDKDWPRGQTLESQYEVTGFDSDYECVDLRTQDGLAIRGWYARRFIRVSGPERIQVGDLVKLKSQKELDELRRYYPAWPCDWTIERTGRVQRTVDHHNKTVGLILEGCGCTSWNLKRFVRVSGAQPEKKAPAPVDKKKLWDAHLAEEHRICSLTVAHDNKQLEKSREEQAKAELDRPMFRPRYVAALTLDPVGGRWGGND